MNNNTLIRITVTAITDDGEEVLLDGTTVTRETEFTYRHFEKTSTLHAENIRTIE